MANTQNDLNADHPATTIYRSMFEIENRLLKEKDIKRLLSKAMDILIKLSGAERAWLPIFKPGSNEIMHQAFKNIHKKDIEQPEFEINRTIIENVKRDGNPVCLSNVQAGMKLKQGKGMKNVKPLSVICIPLLQDKNIFGIVYLDNHKGTGVFKAKTFTLIKEFANFISTAAYNLLEEKQLQNLVANIRKAGMNKRE